MKIDLKISYFSLCLLLFIVAACNSGGGDRQNIKQLLKTKQAAALASVKNKLDLTWTIDNLVKQDDLNSSLKDLGWHLVTLTVQSVDKETQPVAVEGLLAGIYPQPLVNRGQQVLVQDINCANAIFSKAGDSCSAYFKLSYDINNNSVNSPVQFPVTLMPKGDIKSVLIFNSNFQPNRSISDLRRINSFEPQYFASSAINNNKASYQIFMVQNAALKPLNITSLQTPTNPIFTLVHRSSAKNIDDPYYGSQAECALTTNSNTMQTSSLTNLNESCILIYKAAAISTKAVESDLITVASDAEYNFPSWANKYALVAHYVNGTPLPTQAIHDLQAAFHEPLPFSNFYINYNFTPQKLPILNNSSTGYLTLPAYISLQKNQEILTSSGAMTKVISVEPEFYEGQRLDSNTAQVQACGGAWANVTATVYAYQYATNLGLVNIAIQSNSSGHCGNPAPENKVINAPVTGIDQTVYHIDDTGCDGGHWDMGGTVTLNGACDVSYCRYIVTLFSHHGGVGNECKETKSSQFVLNFPKPTTNNIFHLDSDVYEPINFASLGGQRLLGSIGGLTGAINQSFSCDPNGNCIASGRYSNDLTSQDMSYQISLNSGDIFNNGTIQFTRSSGYDLSSFDIEISQRPNLPTRKQIKLAQKYLILKNLP